MASNARMGYSILNLIRPIHTQLVTAVMC